jgi:hypothetical protein
LLILLGLRNVSDKSFSTENQNISYQIFFVAKNRVVYEVIIGNAAQPERPYMVYHSMAVPTSFLAEQPEFHSGHMGV